LIVRRSALAIDRLSVSGDASVFSTGPIRLAFIVATVGILVAMVAPAVRARRAETTE
jgi:TctA family transporter